MPKKSGSTTKGAAARTANKLTRPSPLRDVHRLDQFSCGEPSLDDWLKQHARIADADGTSRTYVTCRGRRVVGFYSLAAGSVGHDETNAKHRRNMPKPIPALILARLARDETERGQELGVDLLIDALKRAMIAAKHVGARMIIVHPISDRARKFYVRFGFRPLKNDSDTHFILVRTALDGLPKD